MSQNVNQILSQLNKHELSSFIYYLLVKNEKSKNLKAQCDFHDWFSKVEPLFDDNGGKNISPKIVASIRNSTVVEKMMTATPAEEDYLSTAGDSSAA